MSIGAIFSTRLSPIWYLVTLWGLEELDIWELTTFKACSAEVTAVLNLVSTSEILWSSICSEAVALVISLLKSLATVVTLLSIVNTLSYALVAVFTALTLLSVAINIFCSNILSAFSALSD